MCVCMYLYIFRYINRLILVGCRHGARNWSEIRFEYNLEEIKRATYMWKKFFDLFLFFVCCCALSVFIYYDFLFMFGLLFVLKARILLGFVLFFHIQYSFIIHN